MPTLKWWPGNDLLEGLTRVFDPRFNREYEPYLRQPPQWHRKEENGKTVHIGEYQFLDGIIVEHRVYNYPGEPPQQQFHHVVLTRLPDGLPGVRPDMYGETLELYRKTRSYDETYAILAERVQ